MIPTFSSAHKINGYEIYLTQGEKLTNDFASLASIDRWADSCLQHIQHGSYLLLKKKTVCFGISFHLDAGSLC